MSGPDHPHHRWSALPARPARKFRNGAALAVCPVVSFETHEDEVPKGWPQPNWLAGGVGPRPDPNIARIGQRDYGLRVGWFRLRDALAAAGLHWAAAIDAMTAEELPALRDALAADVAAGRAEWVDHGLSVNRPIHSGMAEADERSYLAETRARLAACGIASRGWFGIEYGESPRTPALVAATGYTYLLDWCNDEQPFRMTVPAGSLVALPQFADLDDAFCFCAPRGITPQSYGRRLLMAAEGLARDGRRSGRVLLWHLRPFLSGQAFRIGPIADALAAIGRLPGVWPASPTAILAEIEPVD